MIYEIKIARSAEKSLAGLSRRAQSAILNNLETLAENPYPPGCKKLKGGEHWRIRVGDFRILYEIQKRELVVLVVKIGNRRDIYR